MMNKKQTGKRNRKGKEIWERGMRRKKGKWEGK